MSLALAPKYLQAGPLSICLSAEGGNVIVTGAAPENRRAVEGAAQNRVVEEMEKGR